MTQASPLLYVAMPYDQGKSGISAYMRATVKALSAERPLVLVACQQDMAELAACLTPGEHRLLPLGDVWAHPVLSLLCFWLVLPRLIRQQGVQDVFVPAGNRRCLALPGLQVVTTVHDLAPLRLQGKYDALRQLYWRHVLPRLLRRAGQLLAISEQTARDLRELLGLEAAAVAPNGYDAAQFQEAPQPHDAEVWRRHGLYDAATDQPCEYVFYVARLEHPGKNHLGLLQAWQRLPAALRARHRLVLAGSDWHGAETVHAWLAQHRPENVHVLGYVDAADLPALYRGACLYAQPSLYEGFGLPLLEAMISGVPVLSSNRGALPEVGGQAVRLSEPDAASLAQALQELLTQPALRQRLRRAGLERAAQFSWQRHAQTVLHLCRHTDSLRLQGLSLQNAPLPEVMAQLGQRIKRRQPTRLYYVNADCLNLAWHHRAYRQALLAADLLLPDGSGVALGARLTGQRLVANLNGTDMFVPLCEEAQAQGWRVWFLGGRPEVNASLLEQVQARWPGLQIAGAQHGFYAPEHTDAVCERIRADRPDVLFVALGAPQQELWIQAHAASLGVPLMLGVGGLFDFYSGRIPRAPLWLRRIGCEWSWRLWQEPARLWRRYLIGNPLFVWRMLRAGRHTPQLH
ncbi:MAG: WecB/TagA/CpsF family glycosyltransferase [Candidatus Sericytochromatia bacterium]